MAKGNFCSTSELYDARKGLPLSGWAGTTNCGTIFCWSPILLDGSEVARQVVHHVLIGLEPFSNFLFVLDFLHRVQHRLCRVHHGEIEAERSDRDLPSSRR